MRSRTGRHLGALLRGDGGRRLRAFALEAAQAEEIKLPPELSHRDYAVMLLHIGAEIEHALMVEYLYAAYSLGGPGVPAPYREMVRGWQEIILGIAKEEMGHLISVQNVLRLIGAPICLDREDFPWSNEFYPFPFKLERFSKEALAKYLYAESPVDWEGDLAEEVRALAEQGSDGVKPNQVGKLYGTMIKLFSDERFIPDSDFRASTYPFQASWDEWGRGYQGGARGNTTGAAVKNTPDVIVQPVSSRTDVVNALTAIAQQGESPKPLSEGDETSHFIRFLTVYKQLKKVEGDLDPARRMPVNPYAPVDVDGDGDTDGWVQPGTRITHPRTVRWAHLSNVRYRMLLTYLAHTFEVADGLADTSEVAPRGLLINATFGEMYNLRAITNVLSSLPLEREASRDVAGPPFQMPYSLDLPLDEVDCWRLHRDLLQASMRLTAELLVGADDRQRAYLTALGEADAGTLKKVNRILGDRSRGRR